MKAYKFEVFLVGTNAQDYCIGFVKASEAECKKAMENYTEACVCALSKVVFDTYTGAAYIPTPIAFRVDLAKSTITIWRAAPTRTLPSMIRCRLIRYLLGRLLTSRRSRRAETWTSWQ